jgi:type I restriction enzyme S subunit
LLPSFLGQSFPSGGSPWPTLAVGKLVEDGIIDRPIDGNHGETHPKKADFVPAGVPFIMASDLVDGEVDQKNCNFIKREQADALRKGFANDGDVLLSHKGTIGRVALLDTNLDYVMLTPQVTYYRIKDSNRLDRHFLYYALKSSPFQKQMTDVAAGGATRAYIGITRQLDLKLPLPPLDVQRRLVERFRSAEEYTASLVAHYSAKLASTADLRQSLLQRIFSGELTQEESDGKAERAVCDG